jgi:predicted glutamine amidotransferase
MCRFVAYRGDPLPLADLVYRPANSLIHQATQAMESTTRINADGFGVGWYNFALSPEPAVFKDVTPAWNNPNLRSVAERVSSSCIFAHVRAARRFDPVTRSNCHPFQNGSLMWMHNGDVPGRGRLHKRVTASVGSDLVARLEGNTDTELLFILFQSYLRPPLWRRFPAAELAEALRRTILQVSQWWREDQDDRFLALNLCVTDGRSIVASRFGCGPGDIPSLHWCLGSRYDFDGGECRIGLPDDNPGCAIVASERLSAEVHWETVEPGWIVVVRDALSVAVEPVGEGAELAGRP